MAMQLCVLIDYATGENWEMPLHLYEKYQQELPLFPLKAISCRDATTIQYWLAMLPKEERSLIVQK